MTVRKRVAIIGAGVQGLAAARTLVALGYEVRIFERLDAVGGTWHRKKSYPGLASHGPMRNILYPDFPAPAGFDEDKPFAREDFADYLDRYARRFGLLELTSFETEVTDIRYRLDESDRPIIATARNATSGATIAHECDFVVYTTFTTVGFVPRFEGEETYRGRIVHSSDFNDDILNDSLRRGDRILVLGGNKSAADIVYYLESRSYKNYLWVFRRNTWGFDFEKIAAGSLAVRLGFYLYFKLFQSRRLRPLAAAAFLPLRLFRHFLSPFPESHPLAIGFNGAIWKREQIDVLRRSRVHRGEIARIDGQQVLLATRGAPDGQEPVRDTFDLIVCGTSFVQTKDAPVVLVDSNGERSLDQQKSAFLFRSMVHPAAPRIVFWNAAISPGRITISAYLLSLWFHRHFSLVDEGRLKPEAMIAEIESDKEMLRVRGHADYDVWKTFQKAQGSFIERNATLTLKDLDLLDTKTRMILLSASPIALKDIYLAKLAKMRG
ncbi:SidA/IucD/PvdA family monooxygenase [Bradyrhizobium sp. GCM10023182]|uniref:trimethylamine monooxygenase n=1 Tax=Bradyrhizobium zhengyangense TaxID=2911009 RepID=A0ABS9M271_9BRAD|nr:NAD(P)/FAD-dependent oxidoreductase [Bradyrhizobium zhengyangense]MCG2673371.1 NAD(P)/FAD-dependent oxidoreductase [Bradyrhizobium zhengyangense]